MHNFVKLVEDNRDYNYRLYNSHQVVEHNQDFVKDVEKGLRRFKQIFGNKDTTWSYNRYNAFALTSGSLLFYNLFVDLQSIVREYLNQNEPLWIMAWINYHMPGEVLKWHNHNTCSCHGYISITPKDTITEFEGYLIENKPGNIYIGPGNRFHKVVVKNNYDKPRITIGYDIFNWDAINSLEMFNKENGFTLNLSLIPF